MVKVTWHKYKEGLAERIAGLHERVHAGSYRAQPVRRKYISGFFDKINHEWLLKFIEHRVAEGRMLRLIRKWLKVGVVEDGKRSPQEIGTPQGSVISPVLANIYLHYAQDLLAFS